MPIYPRMLTLKRAVICAAVVALVVGGMGSGAGAAPAEGDVIGAGAPAAVRGSYIVVLKAGVSDRSAEFARRVGGKVGHRYRQALHGFEMAMGERAARRLAADPAVAYVEQNQTVTTNGLQSPAPSWGLDRIDQRNLALNNRYAYPATGAGVRAYIVDSGIRFSHTEFGGRAVSGFDAVDGGTADDAYGHGTHMAAIVGGTTFGVAKGVTLVAVRVVNASGNGTLAQVIAGIEWVTADHDPGERAVANLSLGGQGTALNAAVANSIADGVTYVVSAGNANTDACTFTPASAPAAVTVGATTSTDQRTAASNYGGCVDLFAPGGGILSAWGGGDSATNTLTGTSAAAAHTTGAAAILLEQNPGFTPQQVRDALVLTATTGLVGNAGAGSPNKLLYVEPVAEFTLAVTSPSTPVVQGSWEKNFLQVFTLVGAPQPVKLSAALPPGVSATFEDVNPVTSGATVPITIR
ncbi:S8 family peptidase, partial [Virgisporangium aurantiacum]|uniref:S8 family peptidase n=1 Tax=Virgisporangium aurantiacum TaxID=175570 RepID=UPI001951808B